MAKIEDFEKRYVSSVVFNEGDKILVTEENIEDLRKALKNTNFHWATSGQIVESNYFRPNVIIKLHERGTYFKLLKNLKIHNLDAINYVFVNY